MTLEVYDINANDMSTKLSTEYNSGIRTADVIHSKEQTGDYMINFFNKGILHNYQPESIYKNVNQEYLKDMTPLYFETDWWFYNTGIYTETPITNWWDVTKPEWKGSFVLQNPIGTVSYMALFTTMVEHADEMAEAYKACYGEDIVLADDEPTAAHAWMKRVLEMIRSSLTQTTRSSSLWERARSQSSLATHRPPSTGSGLTRGGISNPSPLRWSLFRRGLHELCGSGKRGASSKRSQAADSLSVRWRGWKRKWYQTIQHHRRMAGTPGDNPGRRQYPLGGYEALDD